MITTTFIGMLLMLPLVFGALFQSRPKQWAFAHASIAILEIVGFVSGLILVLIGVFA